MQADVPSPVAFVTFLLTDVEGSTRLWQEDPERMSRALERHDSLAEGIVAANEGLVVKARGEGDSLFCTFGEPKHAVACAIDLQLALVREQWDTHVIRVRIAVHMGESVYRAGDYYGETVNRAARLRAAAHGGQIVLSEAVARAVEHELPAGSALSDLGLHRLKDLVRPERIFQLEHDELPLDFPALSTVDSRGHNLPAQHTTFVGRRREIADVAALAGDHRLVSLTGPGGAGKTRLALELAAARVREHPDGVWLVELASLGDSALVPSALANVLALKEESPGAVADALRNRQLLVVLDNCEHVIAGAASLAASLLSACAGVSILATSRRPLGVPGEVLYRVPGLGGREQDDAVGLFVDRARRANPDFAITDDDAATVREITRHLDGLPLAIELVSARVRHLSLEQILSHIGRRLALVSSAEGAPERHRTLQAAMNWSYELLDTREQLLLQRLSILASSFTLETAEAVAADENLPADDVLELLGSLVDNSLIDVLRDAGGGFRYVQLETVRTYAAGRLAGAGEHAEALARAIRWAKTFCDETAKQSDLAEAVVRIGPEYPNLRELLAQAVRAPDLAGEAASMASALHPYWWTTGTFSESLQSLERLLERDDLSGKARARTLSLASRHAGRLGRSANAIRWADEAVAVAEGCGEGSTLADALANRGQLAWEVASARDMKLARTCLERALEIARDVGDAHTTGVALNGLGAVSFFAEDWDEARRYYMDSLDVYERLGDRVNTVTQVFNLGELEARSGNSQDALVKLEEALVLSREIGHVQVVALCLLTMAGLVDPDRAKELLVEAGDLARRSELQDILEEVEQLSARIETAQGGP